MPNETTQHISVEANPEIIEQIKAIVEKNNGTYVDNNPLPFTTIDDASLFKFPILVDNEGKKWVSFYDETNAHCNSVTYTDLNSFIKDIKANDAYTIKVPNQNAFIERGTKDAEILGTVSNINIVENSDGLLSIKGDITLIDNSTVRKLIGKGNVSNFSNWLGIKPQYALSFTFNDNKITNIFNFQKKIRHIYVLPNTTSVISAKLPVMCFDIMIKGTDICAFTPQDAERINDWLSKADIYTNAFHFSVKITDNISIDISNKLNIGFATMGKNITIVAKYSPDKTLKFECKQKYIYATAHSI